MVKHWNQLWRCHLYRYSEPSWAQPWGTCCSWPCSEYKSWTRWSQGVPFNLSHSVVLWIMACKSFRWLPLHIFLCHHCTPAQKWRLLSYKNYLNLVFPTFDGLFFSNRKQQKVCYGKSSLSLNPETITDVLLLRLTVITKFIPQIVSSENILLPYYKRKIEKLDVKYRYVILKREKYLKDVLNILKSGNVAFATIILCAWQAAEETESR